MAAKAAFDASIDCGITFIDTAEVYGSKVKDMIIFLFILFSILEEYHHVILVLQASFGAINSETLLGRYIIKSH